MKSIGIIIPYFGDLPKFYKVWEVTARKNETIDFFLFTDCEIEGKDNIHVVPCTFGEIKELIQKHFEFPISLDSPYKLCDFKPVYGMVFQKWIGEYDFWGYCDVDLLLGDIRAFFTEEVLSDYERFLYLGHLSLYRNNQKMNQLFKVYEGGGYPALNYKEVYTSKESWYFDEARGMYTKCLLKEIKVFTTDRTRDPIEGESVFYNKSSNHKNQFVILWEKGKCYAVDKKGDKEELLYAHFFRRNFEIKHSASDVDIIKVLPQKVIYNKNVEAEDFQASECKGYKYIYFLRNLKNSIKRYGIFRTIARQKWSKDHNQYIKHMKAGERYD